MCSSMRSKTAGVSSQNSGNPEHQFVLTQSRGYCNILCLSFGGSMAKTRGFVAFFFTCVVVGAVVKVLVLGSDVSFL